MKFILNLAINLVKKLMVKFQKNFPKNFQKKVCKNHFAMLKLQLNAMKFVE